MRLFVAVPLPEEIRRRLSRHAETWRSDLPAARWVPVENLHLTLRFLGEVPAEEIETAGEAMKRAVDGRRCFELALGGPGCFPPRGRPRVLWIGIEPDAELLDLQAALSSSLEEVLGLEPERRRFHPHATLARCRDGWSRSDAERWERRSHDAVRSSFAVTYVDLMESRLAPSGATHHRVERQRLDPAS